MDFLITLPILEKYGFHREHKCTLCALTKYVRLALLNEFGKTPEDLKTNTYHVVLSKDIVRKTGTTINHVGMRDKESSFIFSQEPEGNGDLPPDTGGG